MKTMTAVIGAIALGGAVFAGLAQAAELDEDTFREQFQEAFPQAEVTDIRETGNENLLEVELNGQQIVYASADGQLLFTGDVIELRDDGPVNLKEERFARVRDEGLAKVDLDDTITYQADGEEKAEVYAFTDITCGYCRKMHRHIEEYNEAGITVHYLAFPRGGPSSEAAVNMRRIWCQDDRQGALDDAKLRNEVPDSGDGECGAVVDEQYQLGITFGVRGTPAIYTTEGQQLGGYVDTAGIKQRLGL